VAVKVWVDGNLVDGDQPAISVFDHALLTGDGVFETLKTYGGKVFAVRRHLERLAHSAAGMGLAVPPGRELREAMEAVVAANDIDEGRVRVTVTGGPAPLGSERGSAAPTVIVAAAPQAPWPDSTAVHVAPWPRSERSALAGLKTVSYGENVVALAWAKDRGSSEALFANLAGNLCEGTATNVFVAVDGQLVTPPLTSGCLAGVTRALVIELTGAEERDVAIADLASVDEAFLTGTTREVQPVSAVDGRPLPACPGPLTQAAATAFAALVARDLDP
jgi:branched-chain amino acid aminotransferase